MREDQYPKSSTSGHKVKSRLWTSKYNLAKCVGGRVKVKRYPGYDSIYEGESSCEARNK